MLCPSSQVAPQLDTVAVSRRGALPSGGAGARPTAHSDGNPITETSVNSALEEVVSDPAMV